MPLIQRVILEGSRTGGGIRSSQLHAGSAKSLVRPGSVAIGISQSGQSFATVDALRKASECGAYTVSVTANSNSPIAQAAKDILLIPCGEELIGPKTKGYSATVALLIGTALALKGTQITDESVKTIKSYLGQKDTIDSVAAACPRTNLCFVIGSGDNLGTAREGALKIMEIAKIPSMYFDLEDSMHGPFTTLDDNSFVVVLGIDSYMQERMAGLLKILQHLGAKGILVTSGTISPLDGAPQRRASCTAIPRLISFQSNCWRTSLRFCGERTLLNSAMTAPLFAALQSCPRARISLPKEGSTYTILLPKSQKQKEDHHV